MRAKLLNERPERTYALVFETGDAFMKTLQGFAREKQLAGSHFTAIGAFREAMLGYFDWEKKDYQRIPVREQVEVLSLVGDVGLRQRVLRIRPGFDAATLQRLLAVL